MNLTCWASLNLIQIEQPNLSEGMQKKKLIKAGLCVDESFDQI